MSSYLKLSSVHQTRIMNYLASNPNAARSDLADFSAGYPGAPKGVKTAVKLQLANVLIGQPVSAFWHEVLSDWANTLPAASLSTLPPARHNGHVPETRALVRWLPGEVAQTVLPDGRRLWKSADLCPRLGMKPDHASKHKGTLEEEDYRIVKEGNRQVMWVTKRGMLKLIVRSREAGVRGSFLNQLLNLIIDVYVDFSDTGVVIHPQAPPENIAAALAEVNSPELDQALAENRRLRTEIRRLTYALETEPPPPTEPELILPPVPDGDTGPPDPPPE